MAVKPITRVPGASQAKCSPHSQLCCAWVKEGYNLACQRITGCGDAAFEFVATPTGKAEVVKRSWAALRLWNDVVNRHGLPGVRFGGVAIHAPPIVGGEKLLSQVGRKVVLAHAASRNVSAGGT